MEGSRVAIINAWGENRGDEAMLRALVRVIEALSPDSQVAVSSRGFLDLPDSVSQYEWRDMAPSSTWRRIATTLRNRDRTKMVHARNRRRAALAFLRDCDLVVSAPAGPYIGDMYPMHEQACLSSIRQAADLHKPCVIAATSAGPFGHGKRDRFRRKCLEGVRWWTVREPISFRSALQANFDIEIESCADLVFTDERQPRSIAPLDLWYADDRPTSTSLANYLETPTIGVSITTTPYMDSDARRVPLDATSYVDKMAGFLTGVVRRSSAQLLFFPHHYGKTREMRLIREIQALLPDDVHSELLHPRFDSDWQQACVAKCIAYISNRYHPAIFALKAEIPVFVIVHQFKTEGLLQQVSYPIPMPNTMDTAQDWIKRFDEFWAERSAVRRHILQELPTLKRKAGLTVAKLAPML